MSSLKQITISIPEKKYSFFMELIQNLGFIKKIETEGASSKEEILQGLKEAVEEVKLHKKGKLTLKTAQQFLDEL
jgi:hypothetical protein